MPAFGAKYPKFAPIKTETASGLPTYDTAKAAKVGRLVSANLTVNLASGELYADDILSESVSAFASGSIAMETDDMVDSTAATVYGAAVVDNGLVTYAEGDTPPIGGLAYYKVMMRDGQKLFKGYFYPKVRAALGNDNAATKGSSITFQTTNTTFTVFAAANGVWRQTQEFTTETEAIAWVDGRFSAAGK